MKNTFLFFLATVFFISTACNSSDLRENDSIRIQDTVYNILKDPIFKFDTTGMTMNERIKKLMALSTLKHFDKERTDFIEKDMNSIFKVSELQKKGSNYHYQATSDQYEISIKYFCKPIEGEYTMYMVGVDSIVNIYYKNIKLMLKWDECHMSNDGESCSAKKQIEVYPVKTFFKFDYVKIDKLNSQLTYFRKHIPDNID
jgi:hypothetical protein